MSPRRSTLGGNSPYIPPVCPARKGTGGKGEQFTGVVPDFGDVRKQVGQQFADGFAVGLGKAALLEAIQEEVS